MVGIPDGGTYMTAVAGLSTSGAIRPKRPNIVQKPFRKPLRDVPVIEFKLGAKANR